MKYGIELNGIANVLILLPVVEETVGHDYGPVEESIKAIEDIKKQLDLLERYMIAYATAVETGNKPPYWHEVRENPNQFPTNRERLGAK